MRPPDDWVDELSRALDPEAFEPPPRLHLPLTHRMGLPQRLAGLAVTINEVRADLANGFTSARRNGDDGYYYYCLSGTSFDVFVKSQPEEQTGHPLAVVTSVKPVTRLANRTRFVAATVSFHLPFEAVTCDIALVHRAMERQREQRHRQRKARDRAGDLIARPHSGSAGHSDLHARTLRQYSSLLTVIDLLKDRSDEEDIVRVAGTVLDGSEVTAAGDAVLCLSVDRAIESLRPGLKVTLEAGKRSWTLEVVFVEDRLICLEPPADDEIRPDRRVRLVHKEAFRFSPHSYALVRFRDEDVVGDWSALARLLCAPETLSAPSASTTLRYFNPDLNPRQRAAVAGAVAAPHVFFVQGPPGTGKTTVITEIVRQLVARGERVLLVASMHVAVDEVLRRVADTDGVFALRYSAIDSKVRDDMRRFLPEYVATEFVRRASRPARSKAARWRAEIVRLVAEGERIHAALTARLGLREAEARHADAVAARDEFESTYPSLMAAADSAAALANQRRQQTNEQWMSARWAERAAEAELTAAQDGQGFWSKLAGRFGMGPLRPMLRRYSAALRSLTDAQSRYETFAAAAKRASAHQQAVAEQGVTGRHMHQQACARTAEQVETAKQQVQSAHEGTRAVLSGTDPAAVTDGDLARSAEQRRSRANRLEIYIALEHRWHQIIGFDDQSAEGVERVLSGIGKELLQAANLVCCTAVGFGGQRDIRDTDFDTIIVDEASRVIDSEFLIGAKQARRWILVGDEQQLPPYVHGPDEHHLHALAALHMTERGAAPDLESAVKHLNTLWREDEELHQLRTEPVQNAAERLRDSGRWQHIYRSTFHTAYERLGRDDADADRALLGTMRAHLVQSLFERCVRTCPPAMRERLTEQRRMIDPIAAIVRDPIYRGDYHSPPPADLLEHGVAPLIGETLREPVVLLDTSSQPKAREDLRGTGFVNEFEAEWALKVCQLWERELRRLRHQDQVTASVLTFYSAQAKLIRSRLGHPSYPGFRALKIEKVDSIDAIQGQESDLVLLSFCRTRRGWIGDGFGLWLQDVRRLNVACTRARRSLVLIGHRHTLERLSAVDEARAFYGHLFGLFDEKHPGTLVLRDLRRSG